MRSTRRQFLGAAGGAMMLGGGFRFLSALAPVSAEEAQLHPSLVRLGDDIEPTVRLLEETPPERVLEEVATRIRNGTLSYRQVLAGLLLAGVRNVQPRPQVGFKFHAVLVINSAHLASLNSPGSDRWLPIFWAIDRFKSAQSETAKTSGWRMSGVDESKVPSGSKAREAFIRAMDAWDEEAADAAAAGLARACSRDECFELFARYGCRDFRDIGHKAIYVSNSFRTLSAIGWQNAEPVLRSLAYALMKYDGENPSNSDQPADRPGRRNAELIKKIRPQWQDGKPDAKATSHLLSTFRTGSTEDCPAAVVEALNDGISAASVWDAILAASGELLMRKTNILTLHSVTSSNALRFAFESAADPQTRLLLLLQNAAFVPLFRQAVGKMGAVEVDQFEPATGEEKHTVDEIFETATHDRMEAARKALSYLDQAHQAEDLMRTARRLVFLKGNDAHDYKFSSAVLEDYYHLSPDWRNRYLAASLFYLPSSGAPDNALVGRIRSALGEKGA
ncbi:MAG TPA: hypothetical protein VGI81_04140 [Tepidisphaeraceae bacterium]|jgi:hypothetical protein